MADVIVDVTLFDLIKISPVLNISVSHIFSQYCRLGLLNGDFKIRYKKLLIKLKKPCRFLKERQCAVQRAKPLSCVLFPECYQAREIFPELVNSPVFSMFPCFKKPISISEKRRQVLHQLRRMKLREEALSCYYLFGIAAFIVDSKPLMKRLKKDHPEKRLFSIQDYDRMLDRIFDSIGYLENIIEKIYRLNKRTNAINLFEKIHDDITMQHLFKEMFRPQQVYRLGKNRIKQFKRNLYPPAVELI